MCYYVTGFDLNKKVKEKTKEQYFDGLKI